ncbi:MAG TPA: hypothetical protein VNB54_04180 [Alphaproteobacteria bacterium]|nr:hypothetical protein [Alphaproteobacteria bacterium]
MFALLLSLPLVTVPAAAACSAADDSEKIDVQELVRQAVINLNAREALPRNYTYVESTSVDHPGKPDGHSDDTYEVIEIKGHAFRRLIVHNGQKVAAQDTHEQDDEYRTKWLEVEHKVLDEQIRPGHTPESLAAAVQKIMEEAGLKDWKPQLILPSSATPMGVVLFPVSLYKFQLPLPQLDQSFNLKLLKSQVVDGRKTYVVQANPRHTKDKTSDARNFKIKVWIDENERQIVKVEGKAVRSGPLSHADYAAFSSPQGLSDKEIARSKKQLADSTLYYSEGTTIVQEWTKVNDEVWLLRSRDAKGSHILVVKGTSRFPAADVPTPVVYKTVLSNYKKFRVEHRILPGL